MKKVLATVLTAAMIFSIAGCSNISKKSSGDADEDAILEVAEEFSATIKSGKTKAFTKVLVDSEDEDVLDIFDQLTTASYTSGDTKEAYEAIYATLDYKVDKKSVETKKKGSTVEVTYTVKDFEAVDLDDCEDVDDFIDELDDQDEMEVTVVLEIKEDDGEYLVANAEDALTDIFMWSDFSVDFDEVVVIETTETTEETEPVATETESVAVGMDREITSPYAEYIDDEAFYFDGDYYYVGSTLTNCSVVECDLIVSEEAFNAIDWENEVRFELYRGNELMDEYSVNMITDDDDNGETIYVIQAVSDINFAPALSDPDYFYITEGEYTFFFYDANNDLIAVDDIYLEYVDYGYDFSVEFGDSPELDYAKFVDFYYIGTNAIVLDIYLNDASHVSDYYVVLSKDGEEVYRSDVLTDSGAYLVSIIYASDAGLDEFEIGDYQLDQYDSNDKLMVSTTLYVTDYE